MPPGSAYIVAARRTALGRIGGLHRTRRAADLAAPVIAACLKDCGVSPARIGRLIVGNASETGNPARLVGLSSGLPDQMLAETIDLQCASGLGAIVQASRVIAAGDADAVIAGGVEALSMAPWLVARPGALHQTPRFVSPATTADQGSDGTSGLEADEALAARLKISRQQQDDFALRAHLKAGLAADTRLLPREIVAIKATAEESRDQSAVEPDIDELQTMPPILGEGTLTSGNTSAPHDGAAFAVLVSEAMWTELGKPPAMRLVTAVAHGMALREVAEAPIVALRRLLARTEGLAASDIAAVETSETSAAQAIGLRNAFNLSDDVLNWDGGAIARGHPLGAAGAVLVARLFTRMVRNPAVDRPRKGVAVLGARGGLAMAALFEDA